MEGSKSRPSCPEGKFSELGVGFRSCVPFWIHRDWLWPAVWMLPENNTYGKWPLSGEIDVRHFFFFFFLFSSEV